MRFRFYVKFGAILLATIGMGCGVPAHEVSTSRISLTLGADSVEVLVHTSETDGLTYVNLHDDENTAASAAHAVVRSLGGRLVELRHTGEREIDFIIDGMRYSFDPNRVFTSAGIDSTLGDQEPVPDSARVAIETFSDRLLDVIGFDTLEVVVAVHNNSQGHYSVRSYTTEGRFASDARFAHIAVDHDDDDFFFVTTEPIYVELRNAGYNVVLQDEARVTDDGSLSVLCARQGISYVNAEAEHGHFERQEQMLIFLHELLADRPL